MDRKSKLLVLCLPAIFYAGAQRGRAIIIRAEVVAQHVETAEGGFGGDETRAGGTLTGARVGAPAGQGGCGTGARGEAPA